MPYLHLVFGDYSSKELDDIYAFFNNETFCWFLNKDEDHVAERLLESGFRKDGADPVMLLNLEDYHLAFTPQIQIKPATTHEMLKIYAKVANQAYDLPNEGFLKFIEIAAENRPDIKAFIGYSINDEPVACSMVHIGKEVAAIFWIGVLEQHRKQGIGSDMTKVCIEYIQEQDGGKHIALQSFPEGVNLYQKLGFKTVNSVSHYWSK